LWRIGQTDETQTDDVGVFGSSLSNEYLLAAEYFGLSRGELIALSREAAGIIFADEKEKQRMKMLLDDFEHLQR
jgi:adenosine deaminase